MAAQIRKVFADRSVKDQPAFVTFVTAGYPTKESTVPVLLAMEEGGADIIELGVPFTDPLADGPTIQECNNVSLQNGIGYVECLEYVREARKEGLKAPVILMGYYNPISSHGEQRAVSEAKEAGVNGFIVVDLPPEEAKQFRTICTDSGLSYVPLIAPTTTDERLSFLSSIADSFLYVISKLGTTRASAEVSVTLPQLISRVRRIAVDGNGAHIPLAVGFGVSSSGHFDQIGSLSDGVVIGSKLIQVLKANQGPNEANAVRDFCAEVSGGRERKRKLLSVNGGMHLQRSNTGDSTSVNVSTPSDTPATTPAAESPPKSQVGGDDSLPYRFGEYGGQYVPEALVDCFAELERSYREAKADPKFQEEFRSYYTYMNRPSQLYLAERLTDHAGGAKIWFKREDLNHTGSHKINNAVGQILLAKRLGKKRIIAETGAGQHGVATATVCAKFGLECVVYMGAEDVRRQALNVFRIKMLGGKVVPVESGSKTLKDAINEAMRDWVTNVTTTHYLVGSAIGPHPFPTLVRDFQSVIGQEIKEQMQAQIGKLPDACVACVGGGSNAIGTFHPFIKDKSVRLIGVEAGGSGIESGKHSATLSVGTKGVLHGVMTYILQSTEGQITETHSISAGLDYPGVGPEHSFLKDIGRAEYRVATDVEALKGFRLCVEKEGIIPALETAHAVWAAVELAKELPKDANIVLCCSGRGDKDVEQISRELPKFEDQLGWYV